MSASIHNLKNKHFDWNYIQKKYNYFIYDLEDPRVKEWYIISNPLPTLITVLTYLFLIYKILPNYMKNRKSLNITFLIRIYNLFQIVACLFFIYQTITPLSNPLYVLMCERFSYSTDLISLRRVKISYCWYFLKGIEFIETIFFLLRKKCRQVSFLHVYHHVTTFLTAWFFGKYYSGGLTSFCHLLNSSVHFVMYAYYFLATLGPKWQKSVSKWKSSLTILQIVQLLILITHSGQIILNQDCNLPSIIFYAYGSNVAVMTLMFFKFYNQNYSTDNDKKIY